MSACRTMFYSVLSLLNQCILLLQQQMARLLLEEGPLVPSMSGLQAAVSYYEVGLRTTR